MPTIVSDIHELWAIRYDLEGDYELDADIDLSVTNPDNVDDWEAGDYTVGNWVKYEVEIEPEEFETITFYCHTNTTAGELPTDTDFWTEYWVSSEGWLPIGTVGEAYRFTGDFDGQNHTISNLYINRPTTDYVGLFGYYYLSDSLENIRNLRLTNVSVIGQDYTGGLTGWTRLHLHSADTPNANNMVSGTVEGRDYVGGVSGYFSGIGCIFVGNGFSGTVSGRDYVGGFAGQSRHHIFFRSSFSNANVSGRHYVGGFSGLSGIISDTAFYSPAFEDCYSTGTVYGETYVGGFAGYIRERDDATRHRRCYSTGFVDASTTTYIGGFTGRYATFTHSSCPFVYSWNGTEYIFDTESITSKPFKQIQGEKISILQSLVYDNGYKVKITEELDETTFLDQVELVRVFHPEGTQVFPGENDITINSVENLQEPLKEDYEHEGFKEYYYYEFNKPEADTVKLFMRIKEEGGEVLTWNSFVNVAKENDKFEEWADSGQILNWFINAHGMFKLETWNGSEWVMKALVFEPSASKIAKVVYKVNISDVQGDKLKVRLSCLEDFARVFEVKADFSPDAEIVTETFKPDVETLRKADGNYIKLERGEEIDLSFDCPEATENHTCFLKVNGYYMVYSLNSIGLTLEDAEAVMEDPSKTAEIFIPKIRGGK